MKQITNKEMFDFINSQPRDRKIHMDENRSSCDCGCIAIHFGKEVLGLENFGAGFYYLEKLDGFGYNDPVVEYKRGFLSLAPSKCREVTYGEIQDRLTNLQ